MEYVQERITTLHDFGAVDPPAPDGDVAVVVPLTERDHAGAAAGRVFSTLADLDIARVIVALRARAEVVSDVAAWLSAFDCPLEVLWCNAPAVTDLLADHGLDDGFGKGRDVWLALGVAADLADYVVVNDADATTYGPRHVRGLLAGLAMDHSFAKGYYARVEAGRLYGRLCRLFVLPLLRTVADRHDAAALEYLRAFRYPLAGEVAMTASLARSLPAQRDWGLEIGTLGTAFERAGLEGTVQVDLGRHEHDHRAVDGSGGLAGMSTQVGAALFRVLEDHGVEPDYRTLPERYRRVAARMVDQYAADARFNGLSYDREAELEQVATYAEGLGPPGPDRRLPAWRSTPLSAATVAATAGEALDRPTED